MHCTTRGWRWLLALRPLEQPQQQARSWRLPTAWFQALGSCCEAVQRQNLGSGRSWGQEQGGGAGYLADGAPSPSAGCSLAVLTAEPAPAQLQVLFPPGDGPGALLPHPASSASAAWSSCGRSGRLSSRTGAQTLGSCSSWVEKLQTKKFCSRAILLQAIHAPGSPQPPCRNPIQAVLAGQPRAVGELHTPRLHRSPPVSAVGEPEAL